MQLLITEREKTHQRMKEFFFDKRERLGNVDESFSGMLNVIEEQALTGGKMARATLCRWGCVYSGGTLDTHSLITGSCAVEMLHRFILTHDDIVDRDMTRHSIPTPEHVFMKEQQDSGWSYPIELHGIGMAMIGGDLAHSFAHELVLEAKVEPQISLRVLKGLVDCLTYTAAGWRLETVLKQQRLEEVSLSDIEKAMTLVSAHYSVLWPLRLGSLYAGRAYGDWLDDLEEYGKKLGLAFQLQDDVLGLFGDPATTGKPVGNDLRESKKTLLLYLAHKHSSKAEQDFLSTSIGKEPTDKTLASVQDIVESSGALRKVRQRSEKLVDEAVSALTNSTLDEYRYLVDLANFLISRTF